MSFVQFLNSPAVSYMLSGVVVVLLGVVGTLLHNGIKRLEGYFDAHLSPGDANKINEFLNTVDFLTGLAVQDANSRMVVDLKANGLFSKEVADSVKQAVVNDVLTNLGPLKNQFSATLGPIENIIAQAIEKHVFTNRQQTAAAVQSAKANASTSLNANPTADTNTDTIENAIEMAVQNTLENTTAPANASTTNPQPSPAPTTSNNNAANA